MVKKTKHIFFLASILLLGVATTNRVEAASISQVSPVPVLNDETATYIFNSESEGTIVYGGSCGTADKAIAVVGQNKVTWTLANGLYSNCTVTVRNEGVNSNTLAVPSFESTSKYPVVFVHGWLGNSSAWTSAKSYLVNKGWKSELLVANSITESNSVLCGTASPKQAQEVAGWINAVLTKYPGFEKVDLVGHSRGGSNSMRSLWHGYIESSKVRRVVTLAGANRDCAPYYPAIPSDETPGAIQYSVYYSDGTPDNDTGVNYDNTHIVGAYEQNLHPLSHSELKSHATALAALEKSLLGTVGGNNNPIPPTPTPDTTAPTVTDFTIPTIASDLTVNITTLTATDNIAVTQYCLSETNSSTSCVWGTKPTTYTFASEGTKTLYAFAKDAAGNISQSKNDSVTITLPPVSDTTPPAAPTGVEVL